MTRWQRFICAWCAGSVTALAGAESGLTPWQNLILAAAISFCAGFDPRPWRGLW